jgi:hypothetical protein
VRPFLGAGSTSAPRWNATEASRSDRGPFGPLVPPGTSSRTPKVAFLKNGDLSGTCCQVRGPWVNFSLKYKESRRYLGTHKSTYEYSFHTGQDCIMSVDVSKAPHGHFKISVHLTSIPES